MRHYLTNREFDDVKKRSSYGATAGRIARDLELNYMQVRKAIETESFEDMYAKKREAAKKNWPQRKDKLLGKRWAKKNGSSDKYITFFLISGEKTYRDVTSASFEDGRVTIETADGVTFSGYGIPYETNLRYSENKEDEVSKKRFLFR